MKDTAFGKEYQVLIYRPATANCTGTHAEIIGRAVEISSGVAGKSKVFTCNAARGHWEK